MSLAKLVKDGHEVSFIREGVNSGVYRAIVKVEGSDEIVFGTIRTITKGPQNNGNPYPLDATWLLTLTDDEIEEVMEEIIDHACGYLADVAALDSKLGIL